MAYASKHNTVDEGIVPIGSNLFGICMTASATANKVVSLSAFDVLVEGVTIHVFFQNENTATSPSLQVGSTESKTIRYNGTNGGTWEAGSLVSFTYYNGYWVQNDVQSGGGGGETYTLSINDHTITLTGSGGSSSSVIVPDDDTKYGLSISGHTVSLVEGGSGTQVTVPDNNTTYTIGISGNTLTLTPSSGTAQSVTIPNDNTTYTLAISGHTVTLNGSDGSTDSVTVPDDNTTYTLGISGNTLTLTPSSGTAQSVSIPNDNTTYAIGINGHTITLSGSDGSTDSVTVPDNNTTYLMSINGHTITLTPSSGTAQTVTVPDDNTTYTLTKSGSTITLIGSDGSETSVSDADTKYGLSFINGTLSLVQSGTAQSVSIPDENTTYSISISGHTITLTPSSGTAQTITVPDDNTTYSISGSGNTITLTGSDGSTSSATVSGGGATYPSGTSAEIVAGTDTTDKVYSPSVLNDGIVDLIYPIGSYYETSDASFDPQTAFGGTWVSETITNNVIIEEGEKSTGNRSWQYRKWSNGRVEAWTSHNHGNIAVTTSSNAYGGYRSDTLSAPIPSGIFSSAPTVVMSKDGSQGGWLCYVHGASATNIQFIVGSRQSITLSSQRMSIYAWTEGNNPTNIYRWHRTA